jgi:DNA-binding NarL/FixJ family response regulator
VIKCVSDGQSALDEATALEPDVLVLDISMPTLNGIETARRLTAAGFKGKIVFLTVHCDQDYVHAATTAGATGYVVKCRLASDLPRALQEVLAGRRFVSPFEADVEP